MQAVVVANGRIDGAWPMRLERQQANALVICADGGVDNALRLGLVPHVVLGDFDSAPGESLRRAEALGAQLVRFPTHKDETDAELALRYAVSQGATEILFLGALGDRIDHALANLFLMAAPDFAAVRVRIVDSVTTIELCRNQCEIHGQPGDIVSLLPLTSDVTGVVTEGLEYPLQGESLRFGPARGVSNVMLGEVARVTISDGLLAVVHIIAETGANRNG
jgi:thiamine pyrophosphokinase